MKNTLFYYYFVFFYKIVQINGGNSEICERIVEKYATNVHRNTKILSIDIEKVKDSNHNAFQYYLKDERNVEFGPYERIIIAHPFIFKEDGLIVRMKKEVKNENANENDNEGTCDGSSDFSLLSQKMSGNYQDCRSTFVCGIMRRDENSYLKNERESKVEFNFDNRGISEGG